ncbi:MAG: DUF4157 domain-containing protein [Myxococcales bacterium]|nr:DUF4157 domain-containing protein [Myxococcales bacterium]
MSTLVRPARRANRPAPRAPRAVVAASPPLVAAARSDGWLERQADAAARAAQVGLLGAPLRFDAAAAAPTPALADGRPLRATERTRLEAVFGADLAAVRVHDGPAAAALARQAGARAFAAGRHVVLGAGEAAKADADELLAHEVAHVLQQVGRRGPDGRLGVVDVAGAGPIQRDPIEIPSSTAVPTYAEIGERHVAADDPVDAELSGYVRRTDFTRRMQGDAAVLDALAAQVRDNPASVASGDPPVLRAPWTIQSYVMDLLKAGGRHAEAAALFAGHDIRTTFFSRDFFVALATAHPAEIDVVARWDGPLFAGMHFDDFVLSVLDYLFGVTTDIQQVGDGPAPLRAILEAAPAATGIVGVTRGDTTVPATERTLATVAAVRRLHAWQPELIHRMARLATGRRGGLASLTMDERRQVAVQLRSWCAGVRAGSASIAESDQVVPLVQALVPHYDHAAGLAIAVLDQVIGTSRDDADRVAAVQDALLRGGSRPEFETLRVDYTARFEAVLALDSDGRFPSQASYAAAVQALRRNLIAEVRRRFELPVRTMVNRVQRAAWEGRTPRAVEIVPLLAMARQLVELDRILGDYDADADRDRERRLANGGAAVRAPDLRIVHRSRVARWLRDVAVAVGWDGLVGLADQVRGNRQAATATATAQSESYVALVGTWHANSETQIGRLLDDVPGSMLIHGIAPITVNDLVALYQRLQYEDLARRVRARLDDPSHGDTVWNDALREGRAQFVAPVRHYFDGEVQAALRPDDAERFGEFLWSNPLTAQYVRDHAVEAGRTWHLTPHEPVSRAYFWMLPDLLQLVSRLRGSLFDQLILAHQVRTAAPAAATAPTLRAIAGLEAEAWLRALSDALEAPAEPPAAVRDEITNFHEGMIRQRTTAHDELRAAGRAATTDLRHRRVAALTTLIDGYPGASFDTAEGTNFVRYQIPNEVFRSIDRFLAAIYPPEDQDLQVAALVMELLPRFSILVGVSPGGSLADADITRLRWDIRVGLRELVTHAATVVDGLASATPDALRHAREVASDLVDPAWTTPRRQRIDALLEVLRRADAAVQAQFGMRAWKTAALATSEENYVESVGGGAALPIRSEFHHEGVRYRIVSLTRSFAFHEAVGASPAQLTELDGSPLSGSAELMVIDIGEGATRRRYRVHGSDVARLTTISRAVGMAAISASLAVLAEVLETYVDLLMTGLEFVPGAGQVLMITRFALSIVEFIASGEMDTVLQLLRENPEEVLRALGGAVTAVLDPQLLFEYFLFNHNHLGELTRAPTPPPAAATAQGRAGRLGRVIRRIWGLGRNLVGAFGRAQGRTRRGVERVQEFLFERRYVPRVMRFISDNLPRAIALSELGTELAADAPSLTLASFIDDDGELDPVAAMTQAMTSVPQRMSAMLDGLSTLRLPYQLVDPADLLHIAIDLVVRSLPRRYRLVAGGVLRLLEAAHVRDRVETAIATRLARFADPNTLYRQIFGAADDSGRVTSGPVVNALTRVRDDVVGGVLGQLADVSFLPDEVRGWFRTEAGNLGSRPMVLQFDTAGFEDEVDEPADNADIPIEVEGYRATGGLGGPVPAVTGGDPLPRGERRAAEASFGHDFGHVRVHRGADGAAMAGRFGAEAVTTGSHVYMGPRVVTGSGAGRDIFHHELTHVLQQTGPRPLGGRHDAAPRVGAPGRGLRFDPAREAAADRVAATVRGRSGRGPVDVGVGDAAGLQPALSIEWLGRVLALMASPASIAHTVEGDSATTASHLTDDIRRQISNVATDVQTRFRAGSGSAAVTYLEPWRDTQAIRLISERILEPDRWTAFSSRIDDLARDTTQQAPTPPSSSTAGGASAAATPVRTLRVEAFEAALSRHLLDVTGILVHIEFATVTSTTAPLTLSRVTVATLHLPMIPAQTRLVTAAIDVAIADLDAQVRVTAYTSLNEVRKRAMVLRHTQDVLAGFGLDASNWTTRPGLTPSYRLAPRVITAVAETIRMALTGGDLDPTLLPEAATYAAPGDGNNATPQIGLRVGTFLNQRGPERESHHITQFVLLEYFSNLHDDVKAFEHITSVPEFYGASGRITTTGGGASPQVTQVGSIRMPTEVVGTNPSQRGPGMPTILLAAPTHRHAALHIHNSPEDFPSVSTGERGSAAILRATFFQAMRGRLVASDAAHTDWVDASRRTATDRRAFVANRPSGVSASAWRTRISDQLEAGMKQTYHQLREFMQPRLRTGLLTAERAYYNSAAEQAHPHNSAYVLTPIMAMRAYTAAVRKNAEILEIGGGWA